MTHFVIPLTNQRLPNPRRDARQIPRRQQKATIAGLMALHEQGILNEWGAVVLNELIRA